MLQVVIIAPDGASRAGGLELLDAPRAPGSLVWVDLEGATPDTKAFLENQGFHPLAVEDTFTLQHQPKVEDYGEALFVILRGVDLNLQDGRLDTLKLAAFVEDQRLVTYHRAPLQSVLAVRRKLCDGGFVPKASRSAGHLLYLLASQLMERYFPIVERVAEEVEGLEEQIFAGTQPRQLETILNLRRRLGTLRQVMLPHRQVFSHLGTPGSSQLIDPAEAIYFRDVFDNVFRLADAIDQQRDLLSSTKDTYLSVLSQRTNDVMKVLTLVSVILLPMGVLTGLYGMNFTTLPGAEAPVGFWAILAAMAGIAIGLFALFRRRGWF